MVEQEQKKIAENCKIPLEQIGYVASKISIEVLPEFLSSEASESLALYSEETLRDAIKICDKNKKVRLLASDNTSLINKMVDYTTVHLHIFLLDPQGEYNVKIAEQYISNNVKSRACAGK